MKTLGQAWVILKAFEDSGNEPGFYPICHEKSLESSVQVNHDLISISKTLLWLENQQQRQSMASGRLV